VDRYPLMNPCQEREIHVEKLLKTLKEEHKNGAKIKTISYSSGDTIVVPRDYPTIQQAINHAKDGDTIKVLAGVYRENIIVNKSISIIGDGANITIIDE